MKQDQETSSTHPSLRDLDLPYPCKRQMVQSPWGLILGAAKPPWSPSPSASQWASKHSGSATARGLLCPSPEMEVEDAQCFTAVPSPTPPLPGGCLVLSPPPRHHPSPPLGGGGGGWGLLHNVFVPLTISLCQLEQAARNFQLSGGVSGALHS